MREDEFQNGVLGKSHPVLNVNSKVTGNLLYTGDMKLPGMLYAQVLFSPFAHAKIKSIDVSAAEALEGVHGVVCYRDSPKVRYNGNGEDSSFKPSELVFEDVVRYVGDKVAAVAAETPLIAASAIKLIQVEYEPLPFYLDPEEALAEGACPIHEGGNLMEEVCLSGGDLDNGFAEADRIFEQTYRVPPIHHAALEPHVSLAVYDPDGKLTVYTPSQDVFGQRLNLSKIFSLPMNRIRVLNPAMGGGFGGKIDLITEPVAALLSMKCGRPVKLVYTRRQDISSSTTRHGETIYIRTGVKADGKVIACDYKVYLSAGAHSGATSSVAWAAGGKFFKLFDIPNMRYRAYTAYTNCSVAGAMSGFGSPQLFYAFNSQLNQIAMKMQFDLPSLMKKNLFNPNDTDLRGQNLGNYRIRDCLSRGLELFGWKDAWKEQQESGKAKGRYRIGVGLAAGPHASSLFGVFADTTGVMLKMNEDGSLTIFTGVSDMGNGSNTIQMMLVSEVLGISMDRIACVKTDTELTLFDVGAYASRGTYVGGGAALKAAREMKEKILLEASEILGCPARELVLRNNGVWMADGRGAGISMDRIAAHAHNEHEKDLVAAVTFGSLAVPISGGVHLVKVQVDTKTGEVKPLAYTAVHDVGKVLNPASVEGQLHGGIMMGLGYALSEELSYDEKGALRQRRLGDCGLFRADQMPEIQTEFLDSYESTGPYGAKSIGECATVPSAAAVANAVSNALGHEITRLPIRPNAVLEAIYSEAVK